MTFLDVEWDTSTLNPGLGHELQDFTKKTGIQVNRLPRPDGSLNQLALWRELLQKGAAAPDVVSIDVIWSGISESISYGSEALLCCAGLLTKSGGARELHRGRQVGGYTASRLY